MNPIIVYITLALACVISLIQAVRSYQENRRLKRDNEVLKRESGNKASSLARLELENERIARALLGMYSGWRIRSVALGANLAILDRHLSSFSTTLLSSEKRKALTDARDALSAFDSLITGYESSTRLVEPDLPPHEVLNYGDDNLIHLKR